MLTGAPGASARDLTAVYGAMDVGMLNSLNEGKPVALIEAMAAARSPQVASSPISRTFISV